MRELIFAVLILFAAGASAAEPQAAVSDDADTLLAGDVDQGGYGGPVLVVTSVADTAALLVGGRGAWLIDHRLALGGGGFGLSTDVSVVDPLDGAAKNLQAGYGGFAVSYVLLPRRLVHVSVDALVGGGSLSYRRPFSDAGEGRSDAFFVAELGASLQLNVIRWMRLSISPSYRFIDGVGMRPLRNGDIAGPAVALALDFGRF